MRKHELAEQLRKRQKWPEHVSEKDLVWLRKRLAHAPDNEIIDSYITCSCGKKHIKKEALEIIIEKSKDSDDFLDTIQDVINLIITMHGHVDAE